MVQPDSSDKNRNITTKFKYKKTTLIVTGGIVLGCAIALGWHFLGHSSVAFSQGISYLESQEAQSTADLEKELADKQRARMIEAVNSGEYSIFSLFRNSVIFGDSRIEGLESYGFLPVNEVLADIGSNIRSIPDHLEEVKAARPQRIYFSYGVNDIESNVGGATGENGYGSVYEGLIDQVLEVSPDSQIIVCGILPVSQTAHDEHPEFAQIADYNQQIREMCERRGWTYVDSTDFANSQGPDIYATDGIHYIADFYPEWMRFLLLNEA